MIRKNNFLFLLCFLTVLSTVNPDDSDLIYYPPTAIINAAYAGDEEAVREILELGTDINVRSISGDTALHVAVFQQDNLIVKLLLDYGFDPNAIVPRNGYTPLHNAVSANNVAAVRLLLLYGANKNIRARDGQTPLDKARKEEKREIVILLSR
jgi:ankyrin repeat protein